jgi:hypothetical protein
MKSLMVLAAVAVLAAGSAGCSNCFGRRSQPACRPCVPAPVCAPAPVCGGPIETYSSPTVMTAVPTMSGPVTTAPGQVIPGPEVYTP